MHHYDMGLPENGAWAHCLWPAQEMKDDGKPGDGFWYPIFKQTKSEFHPNKFSSGWWLSRTPLKNMSSSVGMMTFPIYGIKHVPVTNNQLLIVSNLPIINHH